MLGALKLLKPLLAQDGLTCNRRKSSAWSTTPIEGDELPEGLPLTHEGVRVLGSPVGSQRFCADLVRSTLTDAAAPLGSLASIHPQHALLLLSQAAPAYLASTTEALRLLRSLYLPATAALGSNSNALQPSAAHSVTIQDMEGRLPPLALQYLREEQETPSQDQLQRALSQEVHAAKADTLTEESRSIRTTLRLPGLVRVSLRTPPRASPCTTSSGFKRFPIVLARAPPRRSIRGRLLVLRRTARTVSRGRSAGARLCVTLTQQPPSPRRPSPERREHYQRGEGGKRSPARPRSSRRPSPRGQAGQRSPRARSPAQRSPRRSPATRGRGSPGRRWDSGRREQSPPRPHSAGSGGRRGWRKGGGRGGNGNQPDPALDHAADTFVEVVRQARASGAPTHVHIEVTNGPPFAADPGQVAPLRAPMLREYQPARGGQFRTPRQVPGFSAPRLAVGRTPGWPAAFPREAQTAPLPTRAGRDPMLTMCRVLNLAEACEVVANLQLAVCGATRSFPSSFGPGTRGSCVTLAESLESPLAPVSDAPAGVAPLARTFPRHVGDLVGAAQAGTPLDTLQSSAHLLLALSACMRSMLEVEGAEPYTM
ncbi:unnamed protein product [Closterium sp. NIES-64]|nr:unnamed protein product [Closterium sp. NIES-64]